MWVWLRTILALALCALLIIFYSAPLSMGVDKGDEMALCPCKRVLPRVNLEEVALNATTCGEDAWRRGRHQRVIAFTFFEATDAQMAEEKENRQYLQGVEENLLLLPLLYPGHVMRLYFQAGKQSFGKLCELACKHPNLDLCPTESNPKLGNATRLYPLLWRFLPAVDPQVDLFHSRDLDSRLSAREVAAVQEFLASVAQVHGMRDHPAHSAVMMGGMWGARVDRTRRQFRKAFTKLFKSSLAYVNRFKGGWDQVALQRYVWPWAKKIAMVHDSYTCKRFSYTRPFPTQRLKGVGNYVGSVVSLQAEVTSECPVKCRPKNHTDWKTC